MLCNFKFPPLPLTGDVYYAVKHGAKFKYQWTGTTWDFKGVTEELGYHQNHNFTHDLCNIEVGDCGCPGGGGSCNCCNTGSGPTLFFFDASSNDGNIAKFYEEGRVPENLHLGSVATDGTHLRVWVYLEGMHGTSEAPILTIDGVEVPLDRADIYPYKGFLDLTITDTPRTVLATSSNYGRDLLEIIEAVPGPELFLIEIGPYPGAQTELKEGDEIFVRVTCSNDTETCGLTSAAFDSSQTLPVLNQDTAGPGKRYAEGNVIIGSSTGNFPITAIGYNTFGTGSTPLVSEDLVLNQLAPSITLDGIVFHSGGGGLGDGDTADISVLIEDFDEVEYSSDYVTIPDPTVYDYTKTVEYLAGDYIDTQNYHVLATRAANGAETAQSFIITIANENPTAVINILNTDGNVVTSSETGLNYVVQVLPNQDLASVDNLDIPASAGTWLGDFLQESPRVFVRTLQIKDSDLRGPHYFDTLQMTNLAGVTGTEITQGAQYYIQGFQEKIIVFPPYSQIAPIGTSIDVIENVNARYNEAVTSLTLYHDTNFHFDGFTIVDQNGDYDPQGSYLFLTDSNIVQGNVLGSMSVLLVEIQDP